MIEDRSPLRILLLGRKHNPVIDVQGIDYIGVADRISTYCRPPASRGGSAPGSTGFNNDTLVSAYRTNSINQVLHTNDGHTVDFRTSMEPGLPTTNFRFIEHIKHDHGVIFVMGSYGFPENHTFSFREIDRFSIG